MKSDGSNASSTASATTHNVLNNLAGFGLLDTAQEVQSPLTASVAPKVRVSFECWLLTFLGHVVCFILVWFTKIGGCSSFPYYVKLHFFDTFIVFFFILCCSLPPCVSPLSLPRPLPIPTLTLWLNPLSWVAGLLASTIPGKRIYFISFVCFHMCFSIY